MTEQTNNEQEASDSPQSPDSKPDLDWQDILAGRIGNDADPAVQKEAQALRTVILQKHQEELETDKAIRSETEQSQELDRLLARLEKEGLLSESKSTVQEKWFRSFNFSSAATIAVASVLIIALTLWAVLPSPDEPLLPQTSANFKEPPRLRSGMATQSIPVDSPSHSQETATKLIKQLKELNIAYRFTPLEGDAKPDWQLEIYIPFEPGQNILTFLQRWRLKETENGWIQIIPKIARNE